MNPHRIALCISRVHRHVYSSWMVSEVPEVIHLCNETTPLCAMLDCAGIWDTLKGGILLIKTPSCQWTPAGYPWSLT